MTAFLPVALTILVVNVSNTDSINKISECGFLLFFPIFFSFIFSFVVIGMYWVAHHNEMNLIQRSDRPFLWLNLLFLLFIVCIPFSAAYLGKNWSWNWTFDESPILEERKGVFLYSGNLLLAGIMLQAVWHGNYPFDIGNAMCCALCASADSTVEAGAPVAMPCLKKECIIELNIEMVHAGVAALSEWDSEQQGQEALLVIEIFYRMLGKAVI